MVLTKEQVEQSIKAIYAEVGKLDVCAHPGGDRVYDEVFKLVQTICETLGIKPEGLEA